MKKMRTMLAVMLAVMLMTVSVCAQEAEYNARYGNVALASLTINFDKNNMVYGTLCVSGYEHMTGVSGVMKLYDANGTCLKVWSVSDYDEPYLAENTYQCEYGKTYTITFGGYAYSFNQTPADRLDLSVTAKCED